MFAQIFLKIIYHPMSHIDCSNSCILDEIRSDQLANEQTLLKLKQSNTELKQSFAEIRQLVSTNGTSLDTISAQIEVLKRENLRAELWRQAQDSS